MSSVPPVFSLVRNLPEESHNCSNFELCVAAAKVIGRENVFGYQRIGQLWRIYPENAQARLNILAQELAIQGKHLAVESQNPYIISEHLEMRNIEEEQSDEVHPSIESQASDTSLDQEEESHSDSEAQPDKNKELNKGKSKAKNKKKRKLPNQKQMTRRIIIQIPKRAKSAKEMKRKTQPKPIGEDG
ncbi:hypothetical protein ElyMa_006150600 [Elysia marginata]|uniref:Uncharacterized protein n=1 Tax=Elysia marginata TaxID=1093978 RepID=A0AAV4GYT6_9GAST|nr:hypothetical protein ElyMa_006150600 [Elysia marginata]